MIVHRETARFDTPLALECGKFLPEFELAYESYGKLNDERSNAILICHGLTATQHAAGAPKGGNGKEAKPGWWDSCIGPGKPIDTNRFFVVSLNNLGGCHGSTGPNSNNHTHAAAHSHSHAHRDRGPDTYANSDPGSNCDSHTDIVTDINAHPYPNSHPNTNTSTVAGADSVCKSQPHSSD